MMNEANNERKEKKGFVARARKSLADWIAPNSQEPNKPSRREPIRETSGSSSTGEVVVDQYVKWALRNPVFMGSVDRIASSFAEARFVVTPYNSRYLEVVQSDKEVEGMEEFKRGRDRGLWKARFDRPNPEESKIEFMQNMIYTFILHGNCFISFEDPHDGNPPYMRVENPTEIIVHTDNNNRVSGYTKKFNIIRDGKEVVKTYSLNQMCHIKSYGAFIRALGLSYAYCLQDTLSQDVELQSFLKSMFKTGGSPAGYLIFNNTLSTEDYQTFVRRLLWQLKNEKQKGAPLIIEGDAKYVNAGSTVKDIAAEDRQETNAKQISAKLGVPKIMLGSPDGTNFATAKIQEKIFWKVIVLPLMRLFASGLSKFMSREYKLNVTFDVRHVEALSEDKSELIKRLSTATRGGAKGVGAWMTVNEARKEYGLPEIGEEGDLLPWQMAIEGSARDEAPEVDDEGRPADKDEANPSSSSDAGYQEEV